MGSRCYHRKMSTKTTKKRQTGSQADRPAPYKMKQLEEMTGVSRETVRFYISEGLLPPPVKSARNMAWYSEQHVELLRLITRLQNEQFLPLRAIRSLVHGTEEISFTPQQEAILAEIRQELTQVDVLHHEPNAAPTEECPEGFSDSECQELRELGALTGENDAALENDLRHIWARLRKNGLTVERGFSPLSFRYMSEIAEVAVQEELRLFGEKIVLMSEGEAKRLSHEVIPALSDVFSLLHKQRLTLAIKKLLEERS